jgi:hypothetical protein
MSLQSLAIAPSGVDDATLRAAVAEANIPTLLTGSRGRLPDSCARCERRRRFRLEQHDLVVAHAPN